jgi:hypothetical protein
LIAAFELVRLFSPKASLIPPTNLISTYNLVVALALVNPPHLRRRCAAGPGIQAAGSVVGSMVIYDHFPAQPVFGTRFSGCRYPYFCPKGHLKIAQQFHRWDDRTTVACSPVGTNGQIVAVSAVPAGLAMVLHDSTPSDEIAGLFSIDPPGRKHVATLLVFTIDVGNNKR